jgi:dTDP-4-amino-4,6-dideoxygalactose transaminase
MRLNGKAKLRDKLMKHLSSRGVMSKVYFDPVHLMGFYRKQFGYRGGELPLTERISAEVLTLPMYPKLSRQEMDYVVEQVQEFFSGMEGKR